MDLSFYRGKRVFLTGHTGFKGSWMCRVLALAGGLTHGVQRWHTDFPGVVSASANLGRVWVGDGAMKAAEFLR